MTHCFIQYNASNTENHKKQKQSELDRIIIDAGINQSNDVTDKMHKQWEKQVLLL